LPFTGDVSIFTPTIALDMGLGVVCGLILLALLHKLLGSDMANEAWMAAMVVVGGLTWWFSNPLLSSVKSVTVDDVGLTVEFRADPIQHAAWQDITSLRVDSGAPFPLITDDRTLVVVTRQGGELPIPRFVSEADVIAAAVAHYVH